MRDSLLIVGAFLVGCAAGIFGLAPAGLTESDAALWILQALILQVGLGIGADEELGRLLRSVSPRLLWIPVATVIGTLGATALLSGCFARWSTTDLLAVGSGFGYYSLSSILITSLKEPSIGARAAAELGTIALLANVFRELMTLFFAPCMMRFFSPLGPVAAAGVTSMDVTLPVILRTAGRDWLFVAMLHGIALDASVPLLVPLFCAW